MRPNHSYLLITVISLFTILHLNAQDNNTLTSSYFKTPLIGKRYLTPPNGEGSSFLFNGIVNGDVIVITGDTIKNKLLKLDGLRNELIWINDQSEFVSLDSSYIRAFTLYPDSKGMPRPFFKVQIKLPFKADS
ncbi:MAG TPA: hypothetical protein VHO72_05730, partial [Bacteroidales bacterium]|nr:hypothetical protein [Bacteroidales bacterium]